MQIGCEGVEAHLSPMSIENDEDSKWLEFLATQGIWIGRSENFVLSPMFPT